MERNTWRKTANRAIWRRLHLLPPHAVGSALTRLRNWLRDLPRPIKRTILFCTDFIMLLLVIWMSYSLRLGQLFWPNLVQTSLMLLAPMIAIPVFVRLGLYRAVIRYLPEQAIWVTIQAMSLAALLWTCLLFLTSVSGIEGVPRSIPLFYWIFGIWVVAGSRFGAKAFLWPCEPATKQSIRRQVLIYGIDEGGLQLAAMLREHSDRFVAGFLEDDKAYQGRDIMGIRVYHESRVAKLIRDYGIKEILVSLPSVDQERRKKLLADLREHPVKIRALPSMTEITGSQTAISQLRNMEIDDLLGRSTVPPKPELLSAILFGKCVCISGAAGSIGSELVRLVALGAPRRLVLLDIDEYGLYQLERTLTHLCVANVVYALGSVVDERLVRRLFEEHGVEVVFHAAAYKHVPLVEVNAIEGVRNNVLGTEVIARTALECGVQRFVLISTDKAVRPSNVMGATKHWAELITCHYGRVANRRCSEQKFCVVRFGNVLGSSGSVVPLFREQIESGGPVTLTDDGMMRFFMSIHEAAELIVQAGALAEGGDIFLLDMGEQINIRKLAENIIRLAGLMEKSAENPDGDIEIRVIGRRPGEKLVEEPFYDLQTVGTTIHPKILKGKPGLYNDQQLADALERLKEMVTEGDPATMRRKLMEFAQYNADAEQS